MKLHILLLLLAACIGFAPAAFADEDDEADSEPEETTEDDGDFLGPIEVIAPRLYGAPGTEENVTALRRETSVFDTPASANTLTADDIRNRRAARSLSDALRGLPSVLVQKTGPLQHSPFIRGFTGYQNLMLIDGIRLNNSAFRSGPNQYWATIDPLSIGRLELTRGPHSVLYGSDAVGGTVNVLPWRRTSFVPGLHVDGGFYVRHGGADGATFARAETEGNKGRFGWALGYSWKTYDDITSGSGVLPNTGGIHERDADMRFDVQLGRGWWLAAGWQHVRQEDAPRTERTVDSVPYRGTSVGTELRRDFDQERDLVYTRLGFDGNDCCPITRGQFTLSWHRHDQERDRKRTGDRRDFQGFTLNQYGVALQLESNTRLGRFIYGADWYHDEVSSFRDNYLGGVFTGSNVQGPLGDDGTYDLVGVYVEDIITFGCLDLIPGVRFTYASAEADRVDNPEVPGSDPATPGNIISVSNDWTNVVGSLKAIYHVHPWWNVYGSASQAFRAPTLYDLTSFDSTSVVETPAPDLDAEDYWSFELGVHHESPCLRLNAAGWYTILDDTIIRSPTGDLIDGVPEVRKDNIGDGYVWGLEFEAAWAFNTCWVLFGNVSYMDGEVDQLDENDNLVREPLSRMKPLTTLLGLRYEPVWSRFWAEASWLHAEKEDRLSLRDQSDSRRIPPGGTPGYDIFYLRGGYRITDESQLTLSLENLTDRNYRIHGSGQQEPGFNVILSLDFRF